MKKQLKLFLATISLLLLMPITSFATPFYFDLDGADPSNAILIDELKTIGISEVLLHKDATFNQLSVFNVIAHDLTSPWPAIPFFKEWTVYFQGAGTYEIDSKGGQTFEFTTGILEFWIDDIDLNLAGNDPGSNGTYKYNTAFDNNSTPKSPKAVLYGANDGNNIASWKLTAGNGTLGVAGQTDNVDAWFEDTYIQTGYFYDKNKNDMNSNDGLSSLTDIAIRLFTNNTNTLQTDVTSSDEQNWISEVIESELLIPKNGDIPLIITSEGSALLNVVPEPATMLLFGIGLLGLAGITRRKKD